jgi:hypothetical protein
MFKVPTITIDALLIKRYNKLAAFLACRAPHKWESDYGGMLYTSVLEKQALITFLTLS